jgi:hypothetical protein
MLVWNLASRPKETIQIEGVKEERKKKCTIACFDLREKK